MGAFISDIHRSSLPHTQAKVRSFCCKATSGIEEVYDLDSKADDAEAVQSIVDYYTLLALKEFDGNDLPITPKGRKGKATPSDDPIRLLDDILNSLWSDWEEGSLMDDFASLDVPCRNTEPKHAQAALKTPISSGNLTPKWLENHILLAWDRMKEKQRREDTRQAQRRKRGVSTEEVKTKRATDAKGLKSKRVA
ncbi:hypothetical protein N7478_012262 [Penicillium angulare]|uniref:uncharacterized protein n=1 Tax=Penicillium angulare TaxID=116970 RepID=UPI0025423E11|nr:uncharacterized protein N7478_012262 [Penicillium angulare]KAJ5259281.1 hypothetical protein N7478_012262 [Penicillium angulare]